MKARVKWLDHMSFVGESPSGHSVVMDGSPDYGGRDLGVRPMEMVLLGLGGCTAYDVVLLLQKSRQQINLCEVHLEADRAESVPAVFTSIKVHFVFGGESLNPTHVERSVKLSAEKYCSVTRMLEPTVDVNYTWEIVLSTADDQTDQS